MMEDKKPPNSVKISVIIPVYNTEKYLRECLDSVVNQTFSDIEIICVDDGSVDNSLAILKEYAEKDNRIILLSQKNKGGGAARNNGLGIAKGEYLSFLDSDDFLELEALEKLFTTAEERNADVVVCNNKCYDSISKETRGGAYPLYKGDFPTNCFSFVDMKKNIFNTLGTLVWNKFFKRNFINEYNILFQEIKRTNDLFFSFSALVYARRIVVLYDSLIYYRVGKKDDCLSLNYRAPFDFYAAILAFYKKMIEANLYNNLEKWYLDFVVDSCRYNLEFQDQVDSFEQVYSLIKNEIFKRFGVLEKPKEYYNDFYYNWMKKIEKQTVVEYLFNQRRITQVEGRQFRGERDQLRRTVDVLRTENAKLQDTIKYLKKEKQSKYELLEGTNRESQAGLDDLQSPFFFRLGRMLPWFPRKVRGLFKCLKENGLVYTFKLFVKKCLQKIGKR